MPLRLVLVLMILLGLPIGAPHATVVDEDNQLLDRIESYFNDIDTLRANFEQYGPQGERTTGVFMLNRPGLMRIDYDLPSKILMIAEAGRLVYYDGSIKQVTYIPLSRTPLSFVLDDDVDLRDEVEVTAIERVGAEVGITLIQRDEADQGQVTLVFSQEPLELRRWAITDAQGMVTLVDLDEIFLGEDLERSLFHWREPNFFGYPED
ncbi:MAG: outer membrane lipoprotein carrier protein LolA [Pseudomonadota bacterium]